MSRMTQVTMTVLSVGLLLGSHPSAVEAEGRGRQVRTTNTGVRASLVGDPGRVAALRARATKHRKNLKRHEKELPGIRRGTLVTGSLQVSHLIGGGEIEGGIGRVLKDGRHHYHLTLGGSGVGFAPPVLFVGGNRTHYGGGNDPGVKAKAIIPSRERQDAGDMTGLILVHGIADVTNRGRSGSNGGTKVSYGLGVGTQFLSRYESVKKNTFRLVLPLFSKRASEVRLIKRGLRLADRADRALDQGKLRRAERLLYRVESIDKKVWDRLYFYR